MNFKMIYSLLTINFPLDGSHRIYLSASSTKLQYWPARKGPQEVCCCAWTWNVWSRAAICVVTIQKIKLFLRLRIAVMYAF